MSKMTLDVRFLGSNLILGTIGLKIHQNKMIVEKHPLPDHFKAGHFVYF